MNIRDRSPLVLLVTALALARPAAADGRSLAPFLDERTVAVLAVAVDKVDVDAIALRLTTLLDLKDNDLAELKKDWGGWFKGVVAAGGRELYVVASLADVPENLPFVVIPLTREADGKALLGRLAELKQLMPELGVEKIDSAVVAGSDATRKRLRSLRAVERPDIGKALAGAGPVRLVLAPTTDTARVLEETLPTLPEEVGGGSVRPLSRGLRWLSVDMLAPKLGLRLTVQAADADAGRDLESLAGRVIKAIGESGAVKGLDQLLALWKPRRVDDRLELTLDEKAFGAGLRPMLLEALAAERRWRRSTQIHEVLKAMHAYEAKHRRFPPFASHDGDGKPLLSWRVHLLPYLGEGKLYEEFKLDEPWDSPHNKKLIPRMPAVYRFGAVKPTEYKTTLLAPLGEATMFPGKQGVTVGEVTDGTARTILLVDAADDQAVVWTRPADLAFDPREPAKGLATRHGDRILVGMADGASHFLPGRIDAKTLHALFTRAGGEAVWVPE